eukprot:CAMPEP_0119314852 /NCGR_PEP_ID=MMETSP1333-20130426/34064_1 /TAXON_ID=418940 /ORGANISM="Scyphosphaera apsteinii, Strain RCC1455" /LENGTH=706 /DNA_ID=CAMNT_0007320051 /DNA_START=64 /DNA_END=2184 /DNA_ORIENTATION=-
MRFGKKLAELSHPQWAAKYLSYETLKQHLYRLGSDPEGNAIVEGNFLSELLGSVHQVNAFYVEKEAEFAREMQELTKALSNPAGWVLQSLQDVQDLEHVSLPSLVPMLTEQQTTVERIETLKTFVRVCDEIDYLRRFSFLNYLAVTKIVKKHDKLSSLRLREGIVNFVSQQSFYTSTVLAVTFTHAQCVASEIVAAITASSVVAQSVDYSCCICFETLNMPVVLSCAHRFCYGCLARACFYDQHCPLCKKEMDLDPANYHIDPILAKFVDAHFASQGERVRRSQNSKPLLAPCCSGHHGKPHVAPAFSKSDKPAAVMWRPADSDWSSSPIKPPAAVQLDAGASAATAGSIVARANIDAQTAACSAACSAASQHASPPPLSAEASLSCGQGAAEGSIPIGNTLGMFSHLTATHPILIRATAADGGLGITWTRSAQPTLAQSEPNITPIPFSNLLDEQRGDSTREAGCNLRQCSTPSASAMSFSKHPMQPMKRACRECHRAKAACEGDPCTRCERLGKKCIREPPRRRRRTSVAVAEAPSQPAAPIQSGTDKQPAVEMPSRMPVSMNDESMWFKADAQPVEPMPWATAVPEALPPIVKVPAVDNKVMQNDCTKKSEVFVQGPSAESNISLNACADDSPKGSMPESRVPIGDLAGGSEISTNIADKQSVANACVGDNAVTSSHGRTGDSEVDWLFGLSPFELTSLLRGQ